MNKGFTLIEMLVVVTIMVLLISVILVSLRSTINSGRDARIQLSLDQLRSFAENYKDHNNDSYTGLSGDDTYGDLRDDINNQGGDLNQFTAGNGKSYCAYTKTNGSRFCCIDSTLGFVCSDTPATYTTNCDGTTFNCQ